MNPQSQKYLESVIKIIENKYFNEVLSIILFGSLSKKESIYSHYTDVDLIIVVKDSCSSQKVNAIKSTLLSLEKIFLASSNKFDSFFFKGLQIVTGMFVNYFICKRKDFKSRNFKIFTNSPILTFLAPKNSVWWSLYSQHKIIWGDKAIFQTWETIPYITKIDLIRSLLMNCLLSFAALLFFPFYNFTMKYSMEAIKWSLFTWRNYYFLRIFTPIHIVKYYFKHSSIIQRRALKNFIEYRRKGNTSNWFPILACLFVFRIHRNLFY